MKADICCFVPYSGHPVETEEIMRNVAACPLVHKLYILGGEKDILPQTNVDVLPSLRMSATQTLRKIAALSQATYTLLYIKETFLSLGQFALERMVGIAEDTQAAMVYADRYCRKGDTLQLVPVIDYQKGSLRDDFDFGPILLYRTACLKEAVEQMVDAYTYAGLYALRLGVSRLGALVHVNEYLYTETVQDQRKSGEKIFDYVDPKNRVVQQEMEAVCTDHLKRIGGYLPPTFKEIALDELYFEYEASVIIPVRNRVRTIKDAIRSVLSQETDFAFNLIIIDNHSTDGTSDMIRTYGSDPRVVHLIPEREDLGIGGCWNAGVFHPLCGRFAVQLDSDDVYSTPQTLQIMVDAFRRQNCAMVVGTYRMTDFDLNEIPPGIIDHKEWTPDNGRNNALRINGLGAPRAFYTPLLRELKVPNTSYGEDYALGLRFSREYRIGRIYDVLYLCRRWEDNSDAALNITQMNAYNSYKDKIRTWELQARINQQCTV